jgi:site-specific DNA-cytosine methylase
VELTANSNLKAIDLCCGAGGWACAARGLPIDFVAVVDWAEDCLETWRQNHQRHHPRCERCLVDLSSPEGRERIENIGELGPIDLVLGAIPCEELSVARGGKRPSPKQMAKLHELTDAVLADVRRLSPRWWAVEDVIQIEKHLPAPIECGWTVPFRRIEAADFGPQRRLRTFLGVFPDPVPDPAAPRIIGECLLPGPHQGVPDIERYEVLKPGHNQGRVGNGGVRVLDCDQSSWTVVGVLDRGSRQRRQWMIKMPDGRLRRLDWRELARAQGFPDDFVFAACNNRTQNMIGQAVPIHLARAILAGICREATATRN